MKFAITRNIKILNQLKVRINELYGLEEGTPRINLGPCGPFAKIFYEEYNQRFEPGVTICFISSKATGQCVHCCLRLPDGSYFDGGNGVVNHDNTTNWLNEMNYYLEQMNTYDEAVMEVRTNGLYREYPRCPNFSWKKSKEIIVQHLKQLDL